ncbi:pyridoxal 5'-phosphate synthase [Streptomyces sp. SID1328]|uniref:pyridoxine/pyridoxamine 5'-phosphate oxidase n=1 Tax=Streptomyces sp. SID1328 TaxID=2690250 RepID=UPI00136B5BE2|nr:pyridoxal 5'-phosphate synthase [Streptomyces sp. SID1328]MYV37688.1 pyridoxal 5'-phosphate synthase [Streptomyces sp. SID1328]
MAHDELDGLLRSLKVWSPDTTELRPFDPDTAPPTPLPLFTAWLADAARAGQPEPHAMSLATVDEEGRPDVRVLLLHGADADGWTFGTHSTSRKGRDLIAHPYAALAFYWPALGRQVRVRGPVTAAPAEAARADLQARSTGALAAALTGRQSEELASLDDLRRASEAAWSHAREHPTAPAPTWTLYRLHPRSVEFFQGDPDRRHVRLEYRRTEFGWERRLLWP